MDQERPVLALVLHAPGGTASHYTNSHRSRDGEGLAASRAGCPRPGCSLDWMPQHSSLLCSQLLGIGRLLLLLQLALPLCRPFCIRHQRLHRGRFDVRMAATLRTVAQSSRAVSSASSSDHCQRWLCMHRKMQASWKPRLLEVVILLLQQLLTRLPRTPVRQGELPPVGVFCTLSDTLAGDGF